MRFGDLKIHHRFVVNPKQETIVSCANIYRKIKKIDKPGFPDHEANAVLMCGSYAPNWEHFDDDYCVLRIID